MSREENQWLTTHASLPIELDQLVWYIEKVLKEKGLAKTKLTYK